MSKSYTQEEVNQKAQNVLRMRPNSLTRLSTINELEYMAEGEDLPGIRAEFYPGKPDQFFRDVLKVIRENSSNES